MSPVYEILSRKTESGFKLKINGYDKIVYIILLLEITPPVAPDRGCYDNSFLETERD